MRSAFLPELSGQGCRTSRAAAALVEALLLFIRLQLEGPYRHRAALSSIATNVRKQVLVWRTTPVSRFSASTRTPISIDVRPTKVTTASQVTDSPA